MNSCVRYNLFVILGYAPTDFSADTQYDGFYDELVIFVRKSKRFGTAVVEYEFNAQVGNRGASEVLPTQITVSLEGLIQSRADNVAFLSCTHFRRPLYRTSTWHS